MPAYPGAEGERRIAFDDLKRQVSAIFLNRGMSETDAALLADSLATADLRGVHSHGVLRVPEYAEKLTSGGVDPRGKPRVVSDRTSAIVVDGANAMGAIAAHFAMSRAIERARSTGVALAAVRGSNHCGALFYFAMQALPEMIGLCATNALPTMAPWGGRDKIVGINPLAVAIPSGGEPPVVLDAAFSHSSHGKIRIYSQKGLAIPSDWAFDEEGQATSDPAAALKGLLQPIGQYKGVGLAMVFGMLSSLLSGAAYGTGLGNMIDGPKPGLDGHFFLAIDVAAFEDPRVFRRRVDEIVRQVRESRPGGLYAPGGLEFETEARYRRAGIPLNDVTWRALEDLL